MCHEHIPFNRRFTELKLRDIVDEQNPLKKFLFEDVPTLEHIVEFYKKGSGVMKRRILSCIFSEKIYFNEEKDATIIYTKPIEVILQIFNELQNRGNKKRGQLDLFSQLAPLFDERCNYNAMIEYVNIKKLKGNLFRPVQKIDNCTNTGPYC